MTSHSEPESSTEEPGRLSFFISYTCVDESWATWVGYELEKAGHKVALQKWDSLPGGNFPLWISRQIESADCTVALYSPAYFDSHWCTTEWTGALSKRKRLVPLRVAECNVPAILASITYGNLHEWDEASARDRLLQAVGIQPIPRAMSGYPGPTISTTPFPGALPEVFNLPERKRRLRYFTGRQVYLDRLREHLENSNTVAVTALHGLGGVGKTQIAVEYAYRHAARYALVWWVDARQSPLIGEQLSFLARELGIPTRGKVPDDAAAALAALRRRDDWLLIFDDAESPEALRPWLPDGPGRTIITSRHHAWGADADRIEVDVLPRDESVTLLVHRIDGIDSREADTLANELGDLPLAIDQAAAYMERTRISATGYLKKFRARREQMLSKSGDPGSLAYGGTVATTWSLALDRLRDISPAAVQLLDICAHLSPDPIPVDLIACNADPLEPPLLHIAAGADPAFDLDDTIGDILAYSLARRDGDTIQIHRLVQAAIRALQSSETRLAAVATVRSIFVAAKPGRSRLPINWPAWGYLAPQVLSAPALHPDDPAIDVGTDVRQLLLGAVGYLFNRGDLDASKSYTHRFYIQWRSTLGEDHPDTIRASTSLGADLRALGDPAAARALAEETLARSHRTLGEDDLVALDAADAVVSALVDLNDGSAVELAVDTLMRRRRIQGDDDRETLGTGTNLLLALRVAEHGSTRALAEGLLGAHRRIFGGDDPDTLAAANNLALLVREGGEPTAARSLDEDTLARMRRLFGEDHPDTLSIASNLALGMGQTALDLKRMNIDIELLEAARTLEADVLDRRRRILGEDHPDTQVSIHNLAITDHQLGLWRQFTGLGATPEMLSILKGLTTNSPLPPPPGPVRRPPAGPLTATTERALASYLETLHPDALTVQHDLAQARGATDDPAGATAFEGLLGRLGDLIDRLQAPPGNLPGSAPDDMQINDTAVKALRAAAAGLRRRPVDTRAVLLTLMDVDAGEWHRVWLNSRDPEAVRAFAVEDPDPEPGGSWSDISLTTTCATALRIASQIADRWKLGMLTPGALALGLVADPDSAASRSLIDGTSLTHEALIALLQEAILGVTLTGLQHSLPGMVLAQGRPTHR